MPETMTPTTLDAQAVEDWWDGMELYERADWLQRAHYRNLSIAQFDWMYLTSSEQTDLWIKRAQEVSK